MFTGAHLRPWADLSDGSGDPQSRPHITRKLRNKMGTSPPPTPLGAPGVVLPVGANAISHLPITTGPFLNPHSLSVDELPSPYPLPLTSSHLVGGTSTTTSRKRTKGSGKDSQNIGALGKSLTMLAQAKETEIEQDLGEIRRGNKRRRVAAGGAANKP